VSFGTGTTFGSSFTDYLNNQAKYRNTTVYVLDTTPAQEKAINDYLRTKKGKPINIFPDNCAYRTASALEAAGVRLLQTVPAAPTVALPARAPINPTVPAAISAALAEDGTVLQISVPQGSALPPPMFKGFNPK
jgi:hypothetical protein